MATEQTLSIIKPDAVAKNVIGKIYTRFEENGLKIVQAKMAQLSKEEAEGFYAVHKERPFFNDLGGNEDIGEIINDQIEQHPIKQRCIGFDVIATRQGAINPINEKGDDQPDKHHVPFFIDRFQHCQHGKNSTGCSQQVNCQGF